MKTFHHHFFSPPLGEALFVIVAAISRLERDILCQRVKAGLANAKARGKILGRKKLRDDHQILALRNQGHSIRGIAKELHISAGSVQQALKSVSKSSVNGV
jgi:DNA invertase Pin-like site-specific DNA recombinase